MAKIIVDPMELRRFATGLNAEVSTMRERLRALDAARRDLSEVWQDRRFANFERAYEPAAAALGRFCHAAETYSAYLLAKAAKADRFLGR